MIYSNETEFAGSWLLENGNVKDDNAVSYTHLTLPTN